MKTSKTHPLRRSIVGLVAGLCFASGAVQAAESFAITAKKQKFDTEKHSGVWTPRLEKTTEAFFYEISVRNLSPNNPERVVLQYMVFVEQADGKVAKTLSGSQALTVPVGTPVSTQTELFELVSLEVDIKRHVDRKIESKLLGCAIRLIDETGTPLAEKLSSTKLKALTDWAAFKVGSKTTDPTPPVRKERPLRKFQ